MVKYATGGRVDSNYDDVLHLFGGCCGSGYLVPDRVAENIIRIAQLKLINDFVEKLDKQVKDVVD